MEEHLVIQKKKKKKKRVDESKLQRFFKAYLSNLDNFRVPPT